MNGLRHFGSLILIVGLLFNGGRADAQEKDEAGDLARVEVFAGYSLLGADGSNFHGWKMAASFNVNRWFAIAGDVDGHYWSQNTPTGVEKRREYSATVGPHFAYRNKSKFVPFAYVMPGAAWETESHAGHNETNSGLALEIGGGVDLELSKHVALRLIDISASTTHMNGHTSTKPKFSTGIVFHFGRK